MRAREAIYVGSLAAACRTHTPALLPRACRPVLLAVWVTGACNARCRMCDAWKNPPAEDLPLPVLARLLADAATLRIDAVRISGGEPLLRTDFPDILDLVNRHRFRKVVLATNGLLIDEHLDAINASTITQLTVSLDGQRDLHDSLRGEPGAFDRILNGLRRVKKTVKVACLLTNRLVPDLEPLLRLCRDRGYAFEYAPLHSGGPPFYLSREQAEAVDELTPSPADLDRMFALFRRFGIGTLALERSTREFIRDRHLDFRHCLNGYVSVLVYWNGAVVGGCHDFAPVGNLREQGLAEILDGAGYRADARRAFEMDCRRNCVGSSESTAAASPFRSLGYALGRLH